MEKKPVHSVSDSEPEDSDVEMKADTTTNNSPGKRTAQQMTDSDQEISTPAKKTKTTVGEQKKAQANPATSNRPKCRYWDKCFRKNADHLRKFKHPKDDKENKTDADSSTPDGTTSSSSAVKPKHEMKDGETVEIKSPYAEVVYRIKRTGDSYYCTCVGWKSQSKAVDKRTCKHLREHLGSEFEEARVGGQGLRSSTRGGASADAKPKGSDRIPYHKNIKPLLLAHKWSESVDPKGWWLSEKLDGVRAYWDGRAFYSRLGNRFIPPDWFIKGYPADMELDGELFGGRKNFQSTVSIVKNTDERWKDITYQVFDTPSMEKEPFEKRMKALQNYFEENKVATVTILEQEKCRGRDHVEEELERVQGLGGEGLMIRQPGSKYERSRSQTLLKIKTFYDADAVVIGHEPSKTNPGVTGALRCRMACGTEFSVGSGLTDKLRRRPPKIGVIISYKFQELTRNGHPRFPSFLGERIDLTEPKDAVIRIVKSDD